jgi:ABC-type lipoprotein release transport system permease subunit
VLAVGAVALGQFTLVFVNCMMAGSFHAMLTTITGPLLGDVQVHHPKWREERSVDLCIRDVSTIERDVSSVPGVRSVSARLYAAILAASGEKTEGAALAEPAMLVGVEPGVASGAGGLLEQVAAGDLPGEGRVVVGEVLARRLNVHPGQLLAVIGQDIDGFPASDLYTISAVIASQVDMVNRMGVVMSRSDAGTFLTMPDEAHELVIQGVDPERADELAARLRSLPVLAAYEVQSWQESSPEFSQIMSMKTWLDIIFVGILFIAAAAGIANTAMMSTFERTHEFGMLLAVGSRPGRIVGMVLIESVILGLSGVLVGSFLGSAAVLITGQTGINYAALGGQGVKEMAYRGLNISYIIYPRFEWRHIVFGLVAVTLTSAVASVWPASIAARLEPVEAMRQ